MSRPHHYTTTVQWTGNRGSGTLDYRAYGREHLISAAGKTQAIEASSDPKFRGDAERYNPEELFLSSLSACHMLWYLHLAAVNGIVVLSYEDRAEGVMIEEAGGAGRFTSITLRPEIRIVGGGAQVQAARELHKEAGKKCFIANSVNVAIEYAGRVILEGG
jgi:organic hydroperoxide reductase OsmC/OhrA